MPTPGPSIFEIFQKVVAAGKALSDTINNAFTNGQLDVDGSRNKVVEKVQNDSDNTSVVIVKLRKEQSYVVNLGKDVSGKRVNLKFKMSYASNPADAFKTIALEIVDLTSGQKDVLEFNRADVFDMIPDVGSDANDLLTNLTTLVGNSENYFVEVEKYVKADDSTKMTEVANVLNALVPSGT